MRELLKTQPEDPRDWDLEVRLQLHMIMAEKLIDSHPELAYCWLKGADLLRKQIAHKEKAHDHES